MRAQQKENAPLHAAYAMEKAASAKRMLEVSAFWEEKAA